MWAQVENGVITTRTSALPQVWNNISNFNALTQSEVKVFGWVPFSQNIPSHNPETEEIVSMGYTITEDAVIEEFSVNQKPAPTPDTRMSKLDFRSRFTVEELVGIEVARLSHETITVRATLNVLAENIIAAENIDIADPRTILGVNTLATFGLITEERATEILSVD